MSYELECQDCKSNFTSEVEYSLYCQVCQEKFNNLNESKIDSSNKFNDDYESWDFDCLYCGKTFSNWKKENFLCDECCTINGNKDLPEKKTDVLCCCGCGAVVTKSKHLCIQTKKQVCVFCYAQPFQEHHGLAGYCNGCRGKALDNLEICGYTLNENNEMVVLDEPAMVKTEPAMVMKEASAMETVAEPTNVQESTNEQETTKVTANEHEESTATVNDDDGNKNDENKENKNDDVNKNDDDNEENKNDDTIAKDIQKGIDGLKERGITLLSTTLECYHQQLHILPAGQALTIKTALAENFTVCRYIPADEVLNPSKTRMYFSSTNDPLANHIIYKGTYINAFLTTLTRNKKKVNFTCLAPAWIVNSQGVQTNMFLLGMWVQDCATKGVEGMIYYQNTGLAYRHKSVKDALKGIYFTDPTIPFDKEWRIT